MQASQAFNVAAQDTYKMRLHESYVTDKKRKCVNKVREKPVVVPQIFRRVILESPFAGQTQAEMFANINYARQCLRDCLIRGDSPIASHLLYTQDGVLRDDVPDERKLGIEAGLAWVASSEATVVYVDRGISPGMRQGIERALAAGHPVEFRAITEAITTEEILTRAAS